MSTEQVHNALLQLDPDNDNHWTSDGLPRLDTVKFLSSTALTRAELTQLAPGFTRGTPVFEVTQPASTEGEETPAPDAPDVPVGVMQVEAEPEVAVVVGDLEAAEEALADARINLAGLHKLKDDTIQEIRVWEQKEMELAGQVDQLSPPQQAQVGIQQYLKRQREILVERGKRLQNLRAEGITPKILFGGLKAPIDEAMSRKNSRGMGRPGNS